jgi:hypothetical protein
VLTASNPAVTGLREAAGRRLVEKTRQAAKLEALGPLGSKGWLYTLFPQLFKMRLAAHHERFWRWFWAALHAKLHNLPLPDLINAYFTVWSRGHAKSTHARITPIAEAGIVGFGYCLYTSGTQDLANGHVTEIEGLLGTEEVGYYYPELTRPEKSSISNQAKSWRQDLLRLEVGYIIQGIGLNVGIRGANKKGLRPSLIVPDDIDDKKDSPAVADNKADTFLNSVLPTKAARTLIPVAQNLIHEHGVINSIITGRRRALVQAIIDGPIKAVEGLVTEERTTADCRIRDVIVAGEPTWPGYDIERCQEDIDTYGLKAFLRECQHELNADREGAILKPWNEEVHVITWEEFAAVFGQESIPRHWLKFVGHDWAATDNDHHSCVVDFYAVSAQNSRLPGCFFVFESMTFEEATQADDVALRVLKFVAPTVDWEGLQNAELTRNSKKLREAEAGGLREVLKTRRDVVAGIVAKRASEELRADGTYAMWHMSHEAKTQRQVYRNIYGLPFDGCNPGASGGTEEMNHFMRVDYSEPHRFREGFKGFTRFYVIVKSREGLGDANKEHLRYHFQRWKWRPATLTEAGLLPEKPLKQWDDHGNAGMMLFKHFRMSAAPLTTKEKTEERMPEKLKQEHILSLPAEEQPGAVVKRQMKLAEVTRSQQLTNVYDPRIRRKIKRRKQKGRL